MEHAQIISELTPLAREIFQVPDLELKDNLSAANLNEWTSMSFMQLLTAIENHFGFKFKMIEILKLQNMGAVIDAISLHVNNA